MPAGSDCLLSIKTAVQDLSNICHHGGRRFGLRFEDGWRQVNGVSLAPPLR
jgi:hypothetical protein